MRASSEFRKRYPHAEVCVDNLVHAGAWLRNRDDHDIAKGECGVTIATPAPEPVFLWFKTAVIAPALFADWRRRGDTTPIVFTADAVDVAMPAHEATS